MFGRSFALVSALALTAQAFLIPTSEFTKTTTTNIQEQGSQALKITCPGCPFAETDGPGKGFYWTANKENALVLNFAVDDASQTLKLNGVPLYPLDMGPQPLSALQVPQDSDLATLSNDTYARLPLSYEMSVTPKVQEGGHELLSLYFSIIGIEGRPVVGLDDLEITVLKTSENILHIAKIEHRPSSGKCTASPLLCKWKAIIAAKLAGMKASIKGGCHKFRPGHKASPHKPAPKKPHTGALPSHHHQKPHGHHGHRVHYGLRKFFHQLKHLLVQHPILVGIAAGLSAGMLGMVFGSVIVLLMRAFSRSGSRGAYLRVQQVEEFPGDNMVKKELLSDEDLPQYEDLPAADKKDVGKN